MKNELGRDILKELLVTSVVVVVLLAGLVISNINTIKDLNGKISNLEQECITLKSDEATRNQADLFRYIRHKYKRIPSELANSISLNVAKMCRERRMPFELMVGMIEVESGFNPTLVSKAGARGLLQVIWPIWEKKLREEKFLNKYDLHEVEKGLAAGVLVFHDCLDRSSSVGEALWRYNGTNGAKNIYSDKIYLAMGEFSTFRYSLYKEDDGTETAENTDGAEEMEEVMESEEVKEQPKEVKEQPKEVTKQVQNKNKK